MQTRIKVLRRIAAVMALPIAIMGLVPGTACAAAPKPPASPTAAALHTRISLPPAAGPHGVTPAADLVCLAQPTPTPVYSASNKTLHWGGWEQCNTTVTQSWTIYLYAVTGVAPHLTRHLEATENMGCVCTTLSNSWYVPCIGTASEQWQSRIDATAVGLPLVPYPNYGPTVTLTCGAGN